MIEQEAFEKWKRARMRAGTQIREGEGWHAALEWARSQQEPVAWLHSNPDRVDVIHTQVKALLNGAGSFHRPLDKTEHYTIPLYTHPAPIPEGWQLVPKEPTREMMRAFWLAGPYPQEPWIEGYKAMLAAAPKPEK